MKVAIQGTRLSNTGRTTVDLYFNRDNGIAIGLKAVQDRAHINLTSYMNKKAREIESFMKSNHLWQNRTGRAERGLHATVEGYKFGAESLIQITLAHGEDVWYSVYLEYSMGRRFAIIEPTQQRFGPKLLDELNLSELYRFAGNPTR